MLLSGVRTSLLHLKGRGGRWASPLVLGGGPRGAAWKWLFSTRWSTTQLRSLQLTAPRRIYLKKNMKKGVICLSARTRKSPRYSSLVLDVAHLQVHDDHAQTRATQAVGTRHHSCALWHPWWKRAENLTVPYQEVFLLVLMCLKYLVPQMSGLAPAAWEIANYCSVSLIFWFN